MQIFRASIFLKTKNDGFTLLELLIVVLLVSIFVTFASVNWNVASRTGEAAILEGFSIAVSLLREEAVSNYEERVIQFDLTEGRLLAGRVDEKAGFTETGEIHLSGGYRIKDVIVNGQVFPTGKCYMTFHRTGMVDRTIVHMEGADQYYSMLVNPLTGKVTGENGYIEETSLKDRDHTS
jgi:prepilin-type N-terminal cleavage/methylation domain-containing protein